ALRGLLLALPGGLLPGGLLSGRGGRLLLGAFALRRLLLALPGRLLPGRLLPGGGGRLLRLLLTALACRLLPGLLLEALLGRGLLDLDHALGGRADRRLGLGHVAALQRRGGAFEMRPDLLQLVRAALDRSLL